MEAAHTQPVVCPLFFPLWKKLAMVKACNIIPPPFLSNTHMTWKAIDFQKLGSQIRRNIPRLPILSPFLAIILAVRFQTSFLNAFSQKSSGAVVQMPSVHLQLAMG